MSASTLLILAILSLHCAQAQDTLEPAFPNLTFNRPVDFQSSRDGTNRLFVVEQAGIIKVFDNSEDASAAQEFLDIRDKVRDNGNEEGLLGLAFHPEYAEKGQFFVYYTASDPRRTVVSRFENSTTSQDIADPESEVILLEVRQPFGNHNGGQIAFGPDGFLYISLGDGGSAGDPLNSGQNPRSLLGAILRIDVDDQSGALPYAIPPDNPFAGDEDGRRAEIFAYGLRNPWRFSFDSETNKLWTGDVGQNKYEEINQITKGGNYGWKTMEATHCFEPSSDCVQENLINPIFEYGRSKGGSITGGYVYRGTRTPEYYGQYIYADYASGRIWALRYEGETAIENVELAHTNLHISSFGVDQHNELYMCAFDGKIYRLRRPQ